MKSNGIILVDKPKGISSFDVIRILRREYAASGAKPPKMGHSGTLDPLATGLLVIGVGEGTRLLKDLIGLPKSYEAEVLLGVSTDSGDAAGKVVAEAPVPELSQERVSEALAGMVGELVLPVSLFSAIKRGGKRLYEYARAGEAVEAPLRTMGVIGARLLSFDGKTVRAAFDVSSGTYVRSLAEELGRRLGTVASLANLRRVSVGGYRVDDARKVSVDAAKASLA